METKSTLQYTYHYSSGKIRFEKYSLIAAIQEILILSKPDEIKENILAFIERLRKIQD